MQDLVARDEPISGQLKDEAAKLKDIVLTEVRLPSDSNVDTKLNVVIE